MGESVGVGAGIGEEAEAFLLGHRRMLFEQLECALDARNGRLELVAERGGEIAQVTRAALDPFGHGGEIEVESADLDCGGGGRLGDGDCASGDILARLAKRLDRPGDAAGEQAGEDEQGEENEADAERDLAAVLIDAEEQAARRARQHQHRDDAAVDGDRAGVMDPDSGGAAQHFEQVAPREVGALAEHGARLAGKGALDLREGGIASAEVVAAQDDGAAGIEQADRGKHRPGGVDDHRAERRRRDQRLGVGRGCGRGLRLVAEDAHVAQIDGGALRIERPVLGRRGLGPGGAAGAGEGGGLGDQLRLGLLDESVLIDAERHRADPGKRRDEQEGQEEDGPQPERRPVALGELLQPPDQAAPPRQGPIL